MTSQRARVSILLALLAVAASLPRFGQRENEPVALSDSDYYLDMAAVLSGQKADFDPIWSAPGHSGSHHYTRPLLPSIAGWLGRMLPVPTSAAFSLVNVVAAWSVAIGLYLFLIQAAPELRYPWLPSALFLTGFPQIDWGYHVLTDTLGYAAAFLSALAVWKLMLWQERMRAPGTDPRVLARIGGLFVLQALAFCARETGWIVPVAVLILLATNPPGGRRFASIVLGVLLLAALPHALYVEANGLERIAIPLTPGRWVQPGYLLDFLGKSAVAFHLILALAAAGLVRRGQRWAPTLILAWSAGALLYMAAGYAHNSLGGVGYPLRMTYALFPLIYYLAARGLEILVPRGGVWTAVTVVAVNAAIGFYGTSLDRGLTAVTVPSLMRPEPQVRP